MSVAGIAKNVSKTVQQHSSIILTSIAVTGVALTAFLAVRATPRALEEIGDLKIFQYPEEPTKWEIVKKVWPLYIPAMATGAVTVFAISGSHRLNTKRQAALISAYSISETVFKEYQNKVVEQLGKNKEQKVRDEIVQEQVTANPVNEKEIIITGTGKVLCFDTYTARYFESDFETIRKASNDVNLLVINDGYASQNEFYQHLGLPTLELGESVGWTTDHELDVHITTVLSQDNRPCLAIEYRRPPKPNFNKIW